MQNDLTLREFSKDSFWDFFSFIDSPYFVCIGEKSRFYDESLVHSDFGFWFLKHYLESTNEKRISVYEDYSLKTLYSLDSSLKIENCDQECIDIFPTKIPFETLLEKISFLFHQILLINIEVLHLSNNDDTHKFFRLLKGFSLSNSLTIIVFGLHNSNETNEWDVSFEYADICVSYELAVERPLMNPVLFVSQPIDRIYKLAIVKNRFDGEEKSIFLGMVPGKGFYFVAKHELNHSWEPVHTSNLLKSNRYLEADGQSPQVIENNDTVAYVGYFGFSLNGLFKLTKKKNPLSVLVDKFSIYDNPDYEDLDEPIIILEVNPDFINIGDNFTFYFKSNFSIISGQKKFLNAKAKKEKLIDVYLFTIEESLPCLIEHRDGFIPYWNSKLDTFIWFMQSK